MPDKKSGGACHSLHNLAEANPEVKDHTNQQAEIVRELTTLHQKWKKEVNSN